MQKPKLLNLDYWYFMLNVVVPAKNIKLAKRSLDVSLYYCQESHDFESSAGRTQRLLLPICSAIHCRMSRISAFLKKQSFRLLWMCTE